MIFSSKTGCLPRVACGRFSRTASSSSPSSHAGERWSYFFVFNAFAFFLLLYFFMPFAFFFSSRVPHENRTMAGGGHEGRRVGETRKGDSTNSQAHVTSAAYMIRSCRLPSRLAHPLHRTTRTTRDTAHARATSAAALYSWSAGTSAHVRLRFRVLTRRKRNLGVFLRFCSGWRSRARSACWAYRSGFLPPLSSTQRSYFTVFECWLAKTVDVTCKEIQLYHRKSDRFFSSLTTF